MKITTAFAVVAGHDFIDTVSRPSFLLTLIGLPTLLFLSTTFLVPHATSSANAPHRVGIVAPADLLLIPTPDIILLNSYPDGERMLSEGKVEALFVVDKEYLWSGGIAVKYPPRSPLRPPSVTGFPQIERFLRSNLLASVDPTIARLATDPLQAIRRIDGPTGLDDGKPGRYIGPAVVVVGLIVLISFASNYLLHSVALERENKMIEVLLTAVSPQDFLLGKITGLTAASLLHPFLLLALGGFQLIVSSHLPGGPLALPAALGFAFGGLVFMACIMAATGMMLDAGREAQHLSLIWTVWMVVPLAALWTVADWDHSGLIRALSILPLFSPLAMIIRLSFSNVPSSDIALSAVSLLGSILAAFWAAATLFRLSLVFRGSKITVKELRTMIQAL